MTRSTAARSSARSADSIPRPVAAAAVHSAAPEPGQHAPGGRPGPASFARSGAAATAIDALEAARPRLEELG